MHGYINSLNALIQSIGKPNDCSTFGGFADIFVRKVNSYYSDIVKRMDVVFDRYIGQTSIKSTTRTKRTGNKRPIRKVIDSKDVRLPQMWPKFISLDENKANLAEFLSNLLVEFGATFSNDKTTCVRRF